MSTGNSHLGKRHVLLRVLEVAAIVFLVVGSGAIAQPVITQIGPVPESEVLDDGNHAGMTNWVLPIDPCATTVRPRPFGGSELPIYASVTGDYVSKWTLSLHWGGEYEPFTSPDSGFLGDQLSVQHQYTTVPRIQLQQPLGLFVAQGYNTNWQGEILKLDTTNLANGPWVLELTVYEEEYDSFGNYLGPKAIDSPSNPYRQVVYVYNPNGVADFPEPGIAIVDHGQTPMPEPTACASNLGFVAALADGDVLSIAGKTVDTSSLSAEFFHSYNLEWREVSDDDFRADGIDVTYYPSAGNRGCVSDTPCDAPIATWDLHESGIDSITTPTVFVLRLTVLLNSIIDDGTKPGPSTSTEVAVTILPL